MLAPTTEARAADPAPMRKIVMLAGEKSHGPGEHEYFKDLALLRECLAGVPGITCELYADGWPENLATLDTADVIVIHSDGKAKKHPLLQGDRLAVMERQMRRGCGLVVLHYALFVDQSQGSNLWLQWVGGYFDYQTGDRQEPRWQRNYYSKLIKAKAALKPATPRHPVSQGVEAFDLFDEYYYKLRLADSASLTPILLAEIEGESDPQIVSWVIQRPDGGRGFAYSGGHYHRNLAVDNLRRLLLNGILWTAKTPVPAGGVTSRVKLVAEPIGPSNRTGSHP
jgi:type 1 glutamine amidotransferase